jgi:hypothetical protein
MQFVIELLQGAKKPVVSSLGTYECGGLLAMDSGSGYAGETALFELIALLPAHPAYVIQVKRVYNLFMTVFRYGREHYEEGEFVRRKDALPGDGLDPVVRIVEDLGTIEIPCGKVDCRANCLEYLVRSARKREDYALAECKISPLVSII